MTFDLARLKPGDEVAVAGVRGGYLKILPVKRVTPSGQIVLENGDRFMPTGCMVGTSFHDRRRLHAPTEAIREKLARTALIDRLYSRLSCWEKLPTGALARVEAILDEMEA